MEDLALLIDFAMAVVAAFIGGAIAQRFGQPVIVGYLLGGVLIGPFTPGPTANVHSVQVLAEIGVAFLMFALGAEFSVHELKRLGRLASIGGTVQLLGTMALGPLVAPLIGLDFKQGIYLGALLALSSTVVAMKLLMSRGETSALNGRATLGILIAQDLAVVPMVVILPVVVIGGAGLGSALGLAALKTAAVLVGALLLGKWVVPWVLHRVALARSRELFLLGVITLALGTALLTQIAGLSLAFGAFLAGLAVAQSDYRTQVIAEALPFRDVFASLFFVSVGMLIDPSSLMTNAGLIGILTIVTVIGKVIIATIAVLIVGLPGRIAVLTGLGLAQIGEFSFVLARIGIETGAIPQIVFDLILATALVTILLSPWLLSIADPLVTVLRRIPGISRWMVEPNEASDNKEPLRGHTVICGYGRVARELVRALEARGFRYLIIEYNPLIVEQLRRQGIPVVYGDASNPFILEHAHLATARVLAILIPDANVAEAATRHARAMAPRLDIIARALDVLDIERLRKAGANDVVQPEFEAGVEVIHHALQRYGIAGNELRYMISGWRSRFYARGEEEEPHSML